MPLILNRKPGQRTDITFPDGSVAVVGCTGTGHAPVVMPSTLEAVSIKHGLLIRPVGEEWPVCIVEWAGHVDGADWASYKFDAPLEVKIHRDNARVKK